jgi:predicted amidohydrolase
MHGLIGRLVGEPLRQTVNFEDQTYPGWNWPLRTALDDGRIVFRPDGIALAPIPGEMLTIEGENVHTWNGDSVELVFSPEGPLSGSVDFGYYGGMERGMVSLDFASGKLTFYTRDYRVEQPAAEYPVSITPGEEYSLGIRKTPGGGNLVRLSNIEVIWNGAPAFSLKDQYILPEIGVRIIARDQKVRIRRFAHYGPPPPVPEYLHIGGYQVLNNPDMAANAAAISRGVTLAAERRVRLLLTPETSLTGLFPKQELPYSPDDIKAAEKQVREHIRNTPDAPFTVIGLPGWREDSNGLMIRYNDCNLYDPDGHLVKTMSKIHSCEDRYMHGFRLNEFDIDGVPATLHVCHDGLYPDVWTLPVMFGARLVLHPANGGPITTSSAEAFRAGASRSTGTSHAFYVHVSGGGGSFIAGPVKTGPEKTQNLLAVAEEIESSDPSTGETLPPRECLVHNTVRIHDAFGYFPQRSFRMSEEIAERYYALYRACGGHRKAPAF